MAKVIIVAGSRSDLSVIRESGLIKPLDAAGISCSLSVASAHRNPREVAALAMNNIDDALVFIGVAGLAAALPGALAGATEMQVTVIGVPLDVHGIDSCLYMPPGVPVLSCGVGKAGLKNAGIAAAQIAARTTAEREAFSIWLDENAKDAEINIDLAEIRED